jgi:hypothetical protein
VQSASVNFTEAVSGAGRVRSDRLLVDWSSDGLARRVVYDDWDRTLVDQWGLTTSGHIWNLNGDGGSVLDSQWDVPGDGTGTIALPTAPAYRMSLLPSEQYGDNDYQVDFMCPAASGANLEVSQLFAGTTAQTYIEVRINIVPGGQVIAQLVERLDGVETILSQSTLSHSHDANTWYTYRLHRYGRNIRARVWATDTREPIERWDLQASYSGDLSIGFPGIKFGAATGNLNAKPVTIKWRNFNLVNGQFDDMSRQLGAWTVDHHLDDGLPDEVSFVAGTAVPTLRADVIRPSHVSGRGQFTNRAFFSPYNTESPIFGFDRDVPPTTLEAGVVTEDGREYLPVSTGQAQDFTINGSRVTLSAISATRLALAKLVQPPAVYGFYEGANASWLVSYAMAACGVYASPPPQDGCRLWMPMHGSVHPFAPVDNPAHVNTAIFGTGVTSEDQRAVDFEWIDGPYVAAPNLGEVDGAVFAYMDNLPTGDGLPLLDGDDFVSQAGSLGKWEFWVKCDANVVTATPSLSRLFLTNSNGTFVDCGMSGANRLPYVWIDNGIVSDAFFYSTPLPSDGEWRFLGFAWDIAGGKRWINVDGVVETDNTTFAVSGLPTVDTLNNIDPRIIARLPVAEFQLTAGVTANPDNYPWLNEITFTPGAQIVRSSVNLVSIAERAPREAWEIVSSMALAELAMLRLDETDVVRYLGWRHWGQAAQQTVAEVFNTRRNMGLPNVNIDPTKIVNAVAATFNEGFNVDLFSSGGRISDVIALPPGITLFTMPTDENIVELRGFSFTYIASATTTEPSSSNFVSINLATDGTSSYATSVEVAVTVTSWNPGEVTIQFTNTSGATWYTANDKSFATINVAGKLLDLKTRTVTETDDDSILARGERGLPVSLPALQRAIDARRTARRIVNDLGDGLPTLGRVEIRGHPGRQPGDLVIVVDDEAGIDNRFRIQSLYHDDDGELYTQQITARRAREGGFWGVDAYWGQTIWTTED